MWDFREEKQEGAEGWHGVKDALWGEEPAKDSMHSGPGEPRRELRSGEGSVSEVQGEDGQV